MLFYSETKFSNQNDCDYMTIEDCSMVSELSIKSSCTSLLCYNVKSLVNKLTRFQELVSELNWEFDIIGITETWISENNYDLFSLPNYHEPYQNIELTRKDVECHYT